MSRSWDFHPTPQNGFSRVPPEKPWDMVAAMLAACLEDRFKAALEEEGIEMVPGSCRIAVETGEGLARVVALVDTKASENPVYAMFEAKDTEIDDTQNLQRQIAAVTRELAHVMRL